MSPQASAGHRLGPITHLGLVVADAYAAIDGLAKVAGPVEFCVWDYDAAEFANTVHRGSPAPYSSRVAINISAAEPRIEYVQPLDDSANVFTEHVRTSGYGMHHVGHLVEDVPLTNRTMRALGFEVVQEVAGWGSGEDGRAAFYDTREELGYWTEVVQPPRERRPPRLYRAGFP